MFNNSQNQPILRDYAFENVDAGIDSQWVEGHGHDLYVVARLDGDTVTQYRSEIGYPYIVSKEVAKEKMKDALERVYGAGAEVLDAGLVMGKTADNYPDDADEMDPLTYLARILGVDLDLGLD